MKCFIIVFALCAFVCGNDEDLKIIDSIEQEEPCIEMGGQCTIAADCPKGHLAEKQGLCPNQRKQGIDCCHGVSMKETRCIKHGGACMKQDFYCNPSVIFDEATDCGENEKCCLLMS
ncbi:U-scoloptoxin(19)-Sm1a-like [Melitaea cinxia]|uniref:U-scoloptoxin(19)-Sm1a-like n=1 Tax=Melitaea cinxia TaxID=113334 RepID=UPI001E270436|nr:U-scoloptoxin(19)-Sm1a-like [Melitaea cinxia]